MVFASVIFIFFFLPLVLIAYFGIGKKYCNLCLFIASVIFYAWGEPRYFWILLLSIIVNYVFGILIGKNYKSVKTNKCLLVVGIGFNILLITWFKYANFLVNNVNQLIHLTGVHGHIHIHPVHLPIGISFFTFMALAYLIDVYRKSFAPATKVLNFGLYLSMFPHLIAGPIVRYNEISKELDSRTSGIDDWVEGITRFVIGLGKKVLISNTLGSVVSRVMAIPGGELTIGISWLGALCYTFQIYYDFSGYSDMAIGLARFFGFHFPENFKYPYSSQSIGEFWRRWHTTLSFWFRDYLYIPMGGSRHGRVVTLRNLFTVFALCGIWHGASWNFVIWGLYHGIFVTLERTAFKRFLESLWRPLRVAYVFLVVTVGWVFFQIDDLSRIFTHLSTMAGFTKNLSSPYSIRMYLNSEIILVLFLACLGSFPVLPYVKSRIETISEFASGALEKSYACGVFFLSILYLAGTTFNPFIYFRF